MIPPWLAELSEEETQFLKRFILCSGSLKDLAAEYEISYPTVRLRLDRLIEKVKALDDPRPADPFERKLRVLAAEGRVDLGTAKLILREYAEFKNGREKTQ